MPAGEAIQNNEPVLLRHDLGGCRIERFPGRAGLLKCAAMGVVQEHSSTARSIDDQKFILSGGHEFIPIKPQEFPGGRVNLDLGIGLLWPAVPWRQPRRPRSGSFGTHEYHSPIETHVEGREVPFGLEGRPPTLQRVVKAEDRLASPAPELPIRVLDDIQRAFLIGRHRNRLHLDKPTPPVCHVPRVQISVFQEEHPPTRSLGGIEAHRRFPGFLERFHLATERRE